MRRILAQSLLVAQVTFGGMCVVWTLTFFVLTGKFLPSLWYAAIASTIVALIGSAYVFAWGICFEYRWLGFHRLDARVPLQGGDEILASEFPSSHVGEPFVRVGVLYLTTTQLVYVPLRRSRATIVVPLDRDLLCSVTPRDLRAYFKGGIRPRLRVQRRGGAHLFVVWTPQDWVQSIKLRAVNPTP